MTHSAVNPSLSDASEQTYRQLFETNRDGLFVTDRKGRIEDANPAFCRMVGYERDELCAMTVDELTPARWQKLLTESRVGINFSGFLEDYEKEYQRRDGSLVPVAVSAWLVPGSQGAGDKYMASVRDLSERKEAQKSQALLFGAMEKIEDGFAIFGADQRLQYCNRQYLCDYPEIVSLVQPGVSYKEIVRAVYPHTKGSLGGPKLDIETYIAVCTRYFEEYRSYDYQLLDGRWISVKDHRLADGRHIRFRSDISAPKKMELALAENEAHLAEVERIARIGSWTLNTETKALDWSDEHYRIFAIEPVGSDVNFEIFIARVHPDDREKVISNVEQFQATGGFNTIEFRIVRPDGEVRYIRAWSEAAVEGEQNHNLMRGAAQDITESKLEADAKLAAEGRLSAILDNMPLSVIRKDRRGRYDYVNPEWVRENNFTQEEVLGKTTRFTYPDLAAIFEENDQIVHDTRSPVQFEYTEPHAEGDKHFVATKFPLFDEWGEIEYIVGMSVNVSEQKRAQDKLRESQAHLIEAQEIANVGSWTFIEADGQSEALWSPQLCRIYGIEQDAIPMGIDAYLRHVHEQDRDLVARSWSATVNSDIPYEVEHRIVRPNGEVRHVHVKARILEREAGGIKRLIGATADITERKKAEMERAKIFDAVEKIEIGFAIFDAEQRLEYCNDRFASDYPDIAHLFKPGVRYEEILRAAYPLTAGVFDGKKNELEAYIALGRHVLKVGQDFEYQLHDGRWMSVRDHSLGDGRHVRFRSDITAHKQAELALASSEARFRSLFESANVGVTITDIDGHYHMVNAAYASMLGYEESMLLGKRWQIFSHPDDIDITERDVRRLHETGESGQPYEKRFIHKDGSIIWARASILLIDSEGTETPLQAAIIEDITERKNAEVEAKRLREAIDQATEGFALYDSDDRLVYANERWGALYPEARHMLKPGVSRMDILREYCRSGAIPAAVGRIDEYVAGEQERLRGPAGPFELQHANGSWIWGSDTRLANGGTVAVRSDITESKTREIQLMESETRLEEAQRIARVGSWDANEKTGILEWSPEIYRIFGVAPGNFEPSVEAFFKFVHPGDLAMVHREIQRGRETGAIYRYEHRIVLADGQVRWVHQESEPYRNAGGAHGSRRGTIQDITERKMREDELHMSRARLEEAQAIAHIGSWEIDPRDGKLIWSDEVFRMFGRDKAEFEPTFESFMACVHPEDRETVLHAIEHDSKDTEDFSYDHRIILPDGEVRTVREVSLVYAQEDGVVSRRAGTVQDITEQQKAIQQLNLLESEVQRRYRINVMGELASSLAHELNQPLAAVSNYVEASRYILKSSDQEFPDAAVDCLNNAVAQARRAAGVIKSLRRFVGKDDAARLPEDLNETIREISSLVSTGAVAGGVRLELDLADGLSSVMIDRVQIQQVVANLMRNAVESMKESPRRILSISSRQNSEHELVAAISDTGPGLSEDALEKLFEPFHTSKPGGMGIGLTISKKIIESHGGRLWVTPNLDAGTVFHFSLPLEEEDGA